MKKNTEVLIDQNGIEILATYEYTPKDEGDLSLGYYDTALLSVEIILSGKGIEILLLLNEKQKQSIIDKLTYE